MVTNVTIILAEYFNGVYVDDVLAHSGKAKDFSGHTLMQTHPLATVYEMGQDVYNELLDGDDYPSHLSDVPLGRLARLR